MVIIETELRFDGWQPRTVASRMVLRAFAMHRANGAPRGNNRRRMRYRFAKAKMAKTRVVFLAKPRLRNLEKPDSRLTT